MKLITLPRSAGPVPLGVRCPTIACYVQGPLLVVVGVVLLGGATALGNAAAVLILGCGFFAHFVLLHGCGHNCWGSSVANTLIGHYAGVFSLLPYSAWEDLHRDHHRTYGDAEDWGADHALHSPLHFINRWLRGTSVRVWVPFFALVRFAAVWHRSFKLLFASRRSLGQRCLCLCSLLGPTAAVLVVCLTCPLAVLFVLGLAWLVSLVVADSWVVNVRDNDPAELF